MLEKILQGDRRYWMWVAFLLAVIGVGFACYVYQCFTGLGITGMNRDVSWGLYIAQFTLLVGIAASGLMVVIPKLLHHYKKFIDLVMFGEFMAISAVIMCLLFVIVDVGQPMRLFNMILHPTPHSMLFYDMIVLNGYLLINIIVGYNTMLADWKGVPPPRWIIPVAYLGVPWAVAIHTVTAFLYCGLPGRHLWLSALMAPRFLAGAFCSGPALLLLILFIVERVTGYRPADEEAYQTLAKIILYAAVINMFFTFCEFFTAFYSNIPAEKHGLLYMFFGLEGYHRLVPFMRTSIFCGFLGIFILLVPPFRRNRILLGIACFAIFLWMWLEKGFGLVIGGFVPDPFGKITQYAPTLPECGIAIGIWAIGALVLTFLFKMAIYAKRDGQRM